MAITRSRYLARRRSIPMPSSVVAVAAAQQKMTVADISALVTHIILHKKNHQKMYCRISIGFTDLPNKYSPS